MKYFEFEYEYQQQQQKTQQYKKYKKQKNTLTVIGQHKAVTHFQSKPFFQSTDWPIKDGK